MVQYFQWYFAPIDGCEQPFFYYANVGEWLEMLLDKQEFTP